MAQIADGGGSKAPKRPEPAKRAPSLAPSSTKVTPRKAQPSYVSRPAAPDERKTGQTYPAKTASPSLMPKVTLKPAAQPERQPKVGPAPVKLAAPAGASVPKVSSYTSSPFFKMLKEAKTAAAGIFKPGSARISADQARRKQVQADRVARQKATQAQRQTTSKARYPGTKKTTKGK